VAVLPEASRAVTVTLKASSTVAEAGTPVRTSWLAEEELTEMEEEVTERELSEAVRVREPTVLKVMLKEPEPLVRVAAAGRLAAESVEEMATVPL
jgi:hypothetical protein